MEAHCGGVMVSVIHLSMVDREFRPNQRLWNEVCAASPLSTQQQGTRGPVGWACLSALTKLNIEPSIHVDASFQVSDHMVKQFQRIIFRNRPIRNKNCMWWPCLLTDRDEMSNLHRGYSIDASYQVSVVAMFANRSGRNDQSSQRTFHRWFLSIFFGSHVC